MLGARQSVLELALHSTSYEVLPLRSAEESIVSAVPLTVPLSVTMTAGKGVQPTIELTEQLAAHGYAVTPHLAARLFRDRVHLADTVDRLRGAGVDSAFVIAGDGADPHGPFADALGLLEELQSTGHPFRQIGIGGYPEGHAHLDDELVSLSLRRKSTHATHITTQMCFNPGHHDRLGTPGPERRRQPADPYRVTRRGHPAETGADLGRPRPWSVVHASCWGSAICSGASSCPVDTDRTAIVQALAPRLRRSGPHPRRLPFLHLQRGGTHRGMATGVAAAISARSHRPSARCARYGSV